MKSWTSIPFYLWKNTFKRWLEYPVSPFSKILVPTLLALLAVVVLTLFAEIERELRDQLAKNSVYTVVVSEFVAGDNAATILRGGFGEEIVWSERYGENVVKQVRQSLLSGLWNLNQTTPVLGFTSSIADFEEAAATESPPVVWLLCDDPERQGKWEEVSLARMRTTAKVRPVPAWVRRDLSMERAIAVPVEMIEPYLQQGFINHMVANLDSVAAVERFVTDVSAYYRAENRQVKIISALPILKNLERISGVQRLVRKLIVVGCGVILALTLGSIAWLEYRQDSYLLALLKSFGTSSAALLLHMFLENLLLVFVGIGIVAVSWSRLYEMVAPKLQVVGLRASATPTIPSGDLAIIVLAGLIGVVLAMVPVALGLRRPAGLILQ